MGYSRRLGLFARLKPTLRMLESGSESVGRWCRETAKSFRCFGSLAVEVEPVTTIRVTRAPTRQAMELIGPADLQLDEVTHAMLDDVADLARQINDIRPLSEDVLRQLQDSLLSERVFSSNAIEGNTLTIRETRLILQTRTIYDNRRKREAQEALNLGDAALRMEQFLSDEGAWHDAAKFLSIHQVLMKGLNDSIGGVIRHRDVMILGARRQPPGAEQVPSLLDAFFDRLANNENANGLILAAWAHWAIARVHPFEDGNGRMARLWQDLILLRSRLTVAIVRPQEREAYLNALAQADEGEFNPFAQVICQRVIATLQTYINARRRPISSKDGQRSSSAKLPPEKRRNDGWHSSAGATPSNRCKTRSSDALP